jgi:hypothetical protein
MYAGDEYYGDDITSPDYDEDYAYPEDDDEYNELEGDYSEATGDYGQWD